MNLVKIYDVVVHIDAFADAEYDPAAEQAGEGVNIPTAPLLTIRYTGFR